MTNNITFLTKHDAFVIVRKDDTSFFFRGRDFHTTGEPKIYGSVGAVRGAIKTNYGIMDDLFFRANNSKELRDKIKQITNLDDFHDFLRRRDYERKFLNKKEYNHLIDLLFNEFYEIWGIDLVGVHKSVEAI